jgi:hypothetical protein
MTLTIDNFDGNGAQDYTGTLDAQRPPRIQRRLNRPAQLRAWLVADGAEFVVPAAGARIVLARKDGSKVFTGYLTGAPEYEYLGWGQPGPVYRYSLTAESEETLLDRKTLPRRTAFVNREAGAVLKQLASDLAPPTLDVSAVQDVATLLSYTPSTQKPWSEHAAQIAKLARASYRVHDGALRFEPIGETQLVLEEGEAGFQPDHLQFASLPAKANDVTLTGRLEPRAYVKNYFLGDGFSLRFFLSHTPFTRSSSLLVDEEYRDAILRPEWWALADPAGAASVSGGKLRLEGGTGVDGETVVSFVEQLELGGALHLQHGDVDFTAASDGVIGGLYSGAVSISNCVAGFRITPSGAESEIRALVNGVVTGSSLSTVSGMRYVFTTRIYARENFRRGQTFHSSLHPAGNGRGGGSLASAVRFVLEVHEIDPNNPASLIAPSTVLYDDWASATPEYCTYALINAGTMHCAITFTRLLRTVDAEVRSALPSGPYRTRLVGALSEGAECRVTEDSELWFFSAHVPAPDEKIVVQYRSRGRAQARLVDNDSIASEAQGEDNGVRGLVRRIVAPIARTSEDCRNAALAVLDDATQTAWMGEYRTWSDFLPSGSDIFPGDALAVQAPSRGADFTAIVRVVEMEARLEGDQFQYRIVFANEAAEPLALELDSAGFFQPPDAVAVDAETLVLPSLSAAEITAVTSTDVTVDTFTDPPPGGGFEVRWSDSGWGLENDRNLIGRFSTQVFTLVRLSRTQTYYVRAFDSSPVPSYSQESVVLHVNYPL